MESVRRLVFRVWCSPYSDFFICKESDYGMEFYVFLYQVDSLSLPLLFGLVGIYPVPLPAGYSSVSSSCLYCCVWGGLSVFWQFVEFSLLWSFLAMAGVVWVICQGFLVREVCLSVLVGGAGFLLSGVQ